METVAPSDVATEVPAANRPWLLVAEGILRWVTELPAAVLVAVEFALLLVGVAARYLFQHPLYWVDELATTLLLWLGMFGAAVALRTDAHMRLTAFIRKASPRSRARIDVAVLIVVTTFVAELVGPTREFLASEVDITMPSLDVSAAWCFAAVAVGLALMLLIAIVRLASALTPAQLLLALVVVGGVAAGAVAAKPLLAHLGNWNLIVFFVGLVGVLVVLSVPIAFSFGLATLSYLALTTSMPLSVVVGRMAEGMSALVLLAVPLFVLLGIIIDGGGVATALIDFIASLVGHLRGGLAYVLLISMYVVSGISGAKAADMAAVAPVLFPEMKKRGWKPGELVGLLAASGAMGETIPPSLVVIIIGSVTGVSIAALFKGGILPAATAAIALMAIAYFRSSKEKGARGPGRAIVTKRFVVAIPALALPLIVVGTVLSGIATATEVSSVGIAYGLVAGFLIYRKLNWRRLYPMMIQAASLSGAILLIIATATAMAWALTQSGFSQALVRLMASAPGGKTGFLLATVGAFIVLGSFLEGIPSIVLFGPLLYPVSRFMGVNDVHYAMVVILAMGVGLFSPPFGVGFYAACAIGKVSPDEAMTRVFPYMMAVILALLVVTFVPWLSTGLAGMSG